MATDRQITANRLNALRSPESALSLWIAFGTPGRSTSDKPSNPLLDRIGRNRIPAEQTHLE